MTSERPLRVLEVIQRFFPELGGAETHVYEVSRRLARRGDMDISVFATDRTGSLARSERMEGFDVIRRRAWPRRRDYYVSPGVLQVIAKGDWDLVHFQGIHTFVPIFGMLAARRAGIPYILTFHSGGHSSPARGRVRNLQWKLLTPLLRDARRLIGVSRFERRLFEERTGLPSKQFTVIRNGGALSPPEIDATPVPGRIVSSGRLERYKGHHRVIEALAVMRETDSNAHLVILGGGSYLPELTALAQRLGVSEAVRIRHLPPTERAEMARELGSASVLAAFSDYEAHPIGVMEALALGIPVVGYDVAGIADLVEDGTVTGLTPGASPRVAAAALKRAMEVRSTGVCVAELDLPTWEQSTDLIADVYLAVSSRP